MSGRWRRHRRAVVATSATLAVLAPLGWLWWASLVPETYNVMEMGVVDLGGGPAMAGHSGHGAADVSTLTGPRNRPPDVQRTLVARAETLRLGPGREVAGYTLNGSSPGPQIWVTQGDLVEVTLVNESVPDGTTLHWHGVDVPNAEDGVAGVTQDAVLVGQQHVYRFVAEHVGTYWYHSHQVSHEQVRGGLFGTLVVEPAFARPAAEPDVDVVAAVHTYDGIRTVNGVEGESWADAPVGATARVRVVNTDEGPLHTWVAGAPYRVAAVDGYELHRPTDVERSSVVVTAGGRVDLEFTVPGGGNAVRIGAGGGTSLVVGPHGASAPAGDEPVAELDLLDYGSPAPVGFSTRRFDRSFEYRIGRRPGFLDGRPGLWWTVNGALYPEVPMYVVREGDVVAMRIENTSGDVHPMHLHGHHALVLSRNGVPATGSPWWVDSLNVEDGETYELAFVADNPGIWVDHCHNLPHAAQGLLAHLMYEGVTTRYVIGGEVDNRPE